MKKRITLLFIAAMLAASIPMAALAAGNQAEPPSSWAVEQVNAAIAEGLVPVSLQSLYTQSITRAEYCALAAALYEKYTGKEISARKTFDDTNDTNVEKMAGIGVVEGVGSNRFAPDNMLTREQAAVMLSRLAEATGKPLAKNASAFSDNNSISTWAVVQVGQVQAAGIMSGVGQNTFAPKSPYTREQSILTMIRLWDILMSQPGSGKTLTIELGSNPETLDPALNTYVDGANYIIFAFEGLVSKDEKNRLIPGQAESWDVSADGTVYTFHLRNDLKWSDGSPLTASDFVYSWQRVSNPRTASQYADTVLNMVSGFEGVSNGKANLSALGVSAPDDLTFVVELSWSCPYFLELCAFPTLYPVQRATVESNGKTWSAFAETYVSNGPFVISEIVLGSHITFSKNPNYHAADRVKLNTIKCLLIENAAAALATYRSGETRMIKSLPTSEMNTLRNDPDFRLDPIQGTYYLDLNCTREPFTDPRVRMALSLAIDRNFIVNTLMQGTYIPAPNFVGPGISDWDGSEFMSNSNGGKPYIDLNDHEGNVAKAKILLADAGYPDGSGLPEFVYSTNDAAYHKIIAEYLQYAWDQIGVSVITNIVEWRSFTPLRRVGDYDASRDGWICDYDDPSNLLELAETGNGNNNCKFSNPEFDAAMATSRTALTRQARWAALHQAEDVLMREAGLVPVAYYADYYLVSPDITGWWHSPDGFWHFEFADLP
jgi:peptide/nickel transport system substrate-binding protein/oligopeptide transport system substrate-binding protein